jgi:hypothetical protein
MKELAYTKDLAYTKYGAVWIPDVKITALSAGEHTEPLRGYAYSLAVMTADGQCVGWTSDLILEQGSK